jgi:hypothetical protein
VTVGRRGLPLFAVSRYSLLWWALLRSSGRRQLPLVATAAFHNCSKGAASWIERGEATMRALQSLTARVTEPRPSRDPLGALVARRFLAEVVNVSASDPSFRACL